MDTITLASVIAAANRTLAGETARGLISLAPDTLALRFARRVTPDLIISLGRPPAVYLSYKKSRPAGNLPPLADAKFLDGSVINRINQWADDRVAILNLTLASGDRRLGLVELYRRTGSFYLLDEGDVVVSNMYGRRLEKKNYPFPKTVKKLPISEVTVRLLENIFDHGDPAAVLRERVAHLSPFVSATIAAASSPADALKVIRKLAAAVEKPEPVVVRIGDELRAYPADVFPNISAGDKERFDDISAAVAAAVRATADAALLTKRRSAKVRELTNDIKRLKRQLKAMEEDLAGFADAARYRELGDILKANVSKLEKGITTVEVEDLYRGGKTVVALRRELSPQENIAAYYKKYRKAVRGLDKVVERIQAVEVKIEELEAEVERAASADLNALGPAPGEPSGKEIPPEKRVGRRYISSDGFEIVVGRGARENYAVTFGVGRPGDLWLHVREAHGGHVIIKCKEKGKPIPKRTIEEAAALAAYHSKSRSASIVPVIVTERRYVQRAKGAPGLVRVTREEVIFVEPGEVLEPVRET